MSAKHTPGPWEYDEPSNWLGVAARVYHKAEDGSFEPIAQVQYSGWPKRKARANARLIAAAPELLEAITALVDSNDMLCCPNEEKWELARAAIAKATGAAQ